MSKLEGSQWNGTEIAVIGMAGRFPGSNDINQFWTNLHDGVESISFFSEEELIEAGIDPDVLKDPKYVKANGLLERHDWFDSTFFNYTPEEAKVMHPQLRIFHECVWEALEDAAYNPQSYPGMIGLYAGAATSFNWEALSYLSGRTDELGEFAASSLTDKDFLSSRISYKLNLKGPSTSVHTACSTSLVAIHQACRALLTGECNIALAGGVTVLTEQKSGYIYQEGMVLSSDGHCRAFDASADGAVAGSGVGVVVLKPLKTALADRDNIYAIIKGSAINNDGGRKVSFSAPSVEGQSEVIRMALRTARVTPESIGYVETHGTGTALGDPIEISALKLAFKTEKRNFCAVGSIKTNVGHLDAAAGVAGFIKTTLALKNKIIPPSLHFERPNPEIDFDNSPFYVNTKSINWNNDRSPLRAGVSSFGIGGTNAHIILEEAPERKQVASTGQSDRWEIVPITARTGEALEQLSRSISKYLRENPQVNFSDVAYTLQVGRKPFEYRKFIVTKDAAHASELLDSNKSCNVGIVNTQQANRMVIFLFSGFGSQYINMGLELYHEELSFREAVDYCFEYLSSKGYDLRPILYPSEGNEEKEKLASIQHGQVVLFIFEYALAKLLMSWGIAPHAMIGYSFGEYVAACLSGVIAIDDALELVTYRGQLIHETPEGAMISVPLAVHEVAPLLGSELSIAIDNGPSCIISGPVKQVEAFEMEMRSRKILCYHLPSSHAVHSINMSQAADKLRQMLYGITLHPPKIPYISNVTGNWITANEATDPDYWAAHLTQTVRFHQGIQKLLEEERPLFIEIGPARDLCVLIARQIEERPGASAINLVRQQNQLISDREYILNKIGQLWLYGIEIDWKLLHAGHQRNRISLPTYPFQRKHYPVRGDVRKFTAQRLADETELVKKTNPADWFYAPIWEQSVMVDRPQSKQGDQWLVFAGNNSISRTFYEQLQKSGISVNVVFSGAQYENHVNGVYTINPQNEEEYAKLFEELYAKGEFPQTIIHLWGISERDDKQNELDYLDESQIVGLHSMLGIAKAYGLLGIDSSIEFKMITNNMQRVTGDEAIIPQKATILGAIKIIPLEYLNCRCSSIDILLPMSETVQEKQLVQTLLDECYRDCSDKIVAYRGKSRWIRAYKPVQVWKPDLGKLRLKQQGVYLVIGGFGGMGLTLAEHLAKKYQAKLVLVARSPLPPRQKWDEWLVSNADDNDVSIKICKIREFETYGAEVVVHQADVADYMQMQGVVEESVERFGHFNGVIHAGGVIDFGGVIQRRTKEDTDKYMASKVKGAMVLEKLLRGQNLDFIVLFSSFANVLYTTKFGQVSYAAANEFLDSYAAYWNDSGSSFVSVINWCDWTEVGMAVQTSLLHHGGDRDKLDFEEFAKEALLPQEGVEVFERVLAHSMLQSIISVKDLEILLMKQSELKGELGSFEMFEPGKDISHSGLVERANLNTPYAAPENETEKFLCRILEQFFGLDKIGVNDDFFDLGGDSLKAMSVISKIYKSSGKVIAPNNFFNHPTVKGLAKVLSQQTDNNQLPSIPVAEHREVYPLSSAQKRLFVVHRMDPQSTAYNMTRVLVLEGDIDANRLEVAFHQLLMRHEVLRTSFYFKDDELVQHIHEFVDFCMNYMELNDESLAGHEATDEWINELLYSLVVPFDLSIAPLIRVQLIKLSHKRYLFIYDMHHIISDGISMQILFQELLHLYYGESLPELRIQYKDFTVWQNSLLKDDTVIKQREYWLNVFSGELPVLNIATDFPRPGIRSYEGDSIVFHADEQLTADLYRLSLKTGATLYMVLLTAYNILLSKYSGQDDIVVGSPVAGRVHPDVEQLIGVFLNTLAIRSYPKADLTIMDFLADVKRNCLLAFANQDFPFEQLAEALNVANETVPDLSRNPLFDTMFTLHQPEPESENHNGITVVPFDNQHVMSRFDMTLDAVEKSGTIVFSLEYCTQLYSRETAERLSRHFIAVLNYIVQDPTSRIQDIDIQTNKEKLNILVGFNETVTPYKKNMLIHEYFEERVRIAPLDDVIIFGDCTLTYAELNMMANQLARHLRSKGIGRESIVAIMVDPSPKMLVGILAVLKAGGCYVPIDPEYPEDRIRFVLQDSGALMVLTQHEYMSVAATYGGEAVNIMLDELYVGDSSNLDRISSPNSRAYMIYTSGSTGIPKGVMISHRAVSNFITGVSKRIMFAERETLLALTTISFDIFVLESFVPLAQGMRIVLADRMTQKDPKRIGEAIEQQNTDTLQLTPSRLIMLKNAGMLHTLRGLKRILIGGEPLPEALLEELYQNTDAIVYNMYGPTETTVWSTIKELRRDTPLTIGKPIANTRVYILDALNQIQPIGVAGELCIAGDGLALGYWNREELNREKFVPDPFYPGERVYRTGDFASWLPNGEIKFWGRRDHQVKIRGMRIELGEIENRLLKHAYITEAVVIVRQIGEDDKLCAYFVAREKITSSELRIHLTASMPDYMIPDHFQQIDLMPITPNGKVDRVALTTIDSNYETHDEYEAPASELEKKLALIYENVLGISNVGVNDSFFELGGNSLLIIKLEVELEKQGEQVDLNNIYKHNRIRELAEFIEKQEKEINSNTEHLGIQQVEPTLVTATRYPLGTRSESTMKVLRHVKPFNEVFYKSCFFNSLFPVLRYFNKSILSILTNDIVAYRYDSRNTEDEFGVQYVPVRSVDQLMRDIGIGYKSINICKDVCSEIIDAILNGKPVIIWVDCFYESIRKDCFQKLHWPHTLVIYGFDEKREVFYVIEHKHRDNLSYEQCEISYQEISQAYEGYIEYFHESGESPTYYEFQLDEVYLNRELGAEEEVEFIYDTMFRNQMIEHAELVTGGLEHLRTFTVDFERIVSDPLLLAAKLQNYIDCLNTVLNAVDMRVYRDEALFGRDDELTQMLHKISENWRKVRNKLAKYQYSNNYRSDEIQQLISCLHVIDQQEQQYLRQLFSTANILL